MRTRASVCARKMRFDSARHAVAAIRPGGPALFPYRCDRCGRYHLTGRSKGRRLPRP